MLFNQLDILNRRLLLERPGERRLVRLDKEMKALGISSFFLSEYLRHRPWQEQWILKQLLVIGQEKGLHGASKGDLEQFCEKLFPIDQFYTELGGILGYQIEILSRLKNKESSLFEGSSFHCPYFHDLSKPTFDVQEAVSLGLEALPYTAELYPLGGAADRLHLVDPVTGSDLPAAKLQFLGRSLFEGLIRDVQAREYLYEKVYGKKIVIPIGIMSSAEKDNHRFILQMCEANHWFNRPKDSFRLFCQPLVPVVDEKGDWIWTGPARVLLKPGGHGVLWKVARDEGVFTWLKSRGIEQMLVRQINNPLAGIDSGLLAFLGLGVKGRMAFGFVSCPRLLKAAEGVNILVERNKGDHLERTLTNIEYCDFVRYGIDDVPLVEGGIYSRFTSNTNILFARLEDVERAVRTCPYPGLLINMKSTNVSFQSGEKRHITIGRLESTMQNIADVFVEEHPLGSDSKTDRTFVMYNDRRKTISTTKKAYLPGGPFQETPEQGFYDLLQASREVLLSCCNYFLPPSRSVAEVEQFGPECVFLYHPALGPLYSIIQEKIQQGRLGLGSELQIELAQMELTSLELDGSLRILAEKPTISRCVFRNVRVFNKGVDWEHSRPFWTYKLKRFESLEIHLQGNSELLVEDVEILGNQRWTVESGIQMIVTKSGVTKKEINQGAELPSAL